jgi:hypothetical protein
MERRLNKFGGFQGGKPRKHFLSGRETTKIIVQRGKSANRTEWIPRRSVSSGMDKKVSFKTETKKTVSF